MQLPFGTLNYRRHCDAASLLCWHFTAPRARPYCLLPWRGPCEQTWSGSGSFGRCRRMLAAVGGRKRADRQPLDPASLGGSMTDLSIRGPILSTSTMTSLP